MHPDVSVYMLWLQGYGVCARLPALEEYCKTRFFRVPFISRAWQVRENNGPRKFEYSSVSV